MDASLRIDSLSHVMNQVRHIRDKQYACLQRFFRNHAQIPVISEVRQQALHLLNHAWSIIGAGRRMSGNRGEVHRYEQK